MIELSIIVPVYNQEKYIEDCIKSLLNQNIENYEIILINDGSSDLSDDICRKYIHDKRIKYISQNNKGLGESRNVGVEQAIGEFVLFVDSDDCLKTNSLKQLLHFAHSGNYDVVYFDELICDENLKITAVSATFNKMCQSIAKEDALRLCFNPSHICSRLYKRKLVENIRFKTIWYEDMEAFPKLLILSQNIGYFKVPLYYYRQHLGAITHNDMDKKNLDVIKAWDCMLEYANKNTEIKHIIEESIINSVVTFCFFKPMFSVNYITWYNEKLAKEEKEISKTVNYEDINSTFELQAQVYMPNEYLKIQKLKKIFETGENAYFAEYTDVSINEGVCFECKDGCLNLYGIKEKKNSVFIKKVLDILSNTNLISLDGNIKENLINKTVLLVAMLERKKIQMK